MALKPVCARLLLKVRALGFDITPSWLISAIAGFGRAAVKLSGFDEPLRVALTAAPRLDNIELEFAGVDQ